MANTPVFRTSYTCKKDGKCPFCNPRLAALMRADAAGDAVTVSRMLDEDMAAVIRAKEASMSTTITVPKAAQHRGAAAPTICNKCGGVKTAPAAATTSPTPTPPRAASVQTTVEVQTTPSPTNDDLRDHILLLRDATARIGRAERAVYESETARMRSAQQGEAAPPPIDLNARIRATRGVR